MAQRIPLWAQDKGFDGRTNLANELFKSFSCFSVLVLLPVGVSQILMVLTLKYLVRDQVVVVVVGSDLIDIATLASDHSGASITSLVSRGNLYVR